MNNLLLLRQKKFLFLLIIKIFKIYQFEFRYCPIDIIVLSIFVKQLTILKI